MIFRVHNSNYAHFDLTCFYLSHGDGTSTRALLGTQRVLRHLKLCGLPEVISFDWRAECFDETGQSLGATLTQTSRSEEYAFDSDEFFANTAIGKAKIMSGSVRLTIESVTYESEPAAGTTQSPIALDGVFLICRPGLFITGTHMYHSVWKYSRFAIAKHYLKAFLLAAVRNFRRMFSRKNYGLWKGDAVAAVAVHATPTAGGQGVVVMHNDNWYPGLSSQLEFRDEQGKVTTRTIPSLGPAASYTALAELTPEPTADGVWAQALCIAPPLSMSRFLAGEKFRDGSITLDHAYFQQPVGSAWGKEQEPRFFSKKLLSEKNLGPTNPWFCAHGPDVESLVAISNQFHPHLEYRYDLLLFAEDGKLVLRKPEFCVVPAWGFVVPSVSEVLRHAGIDSFQGTYVLAYSASNVQDMLPSRMHVQGIYRFKGGYWNGVQSDASIWSTPTNPIPEMEELSSAKVRRRQLWYAPVIEGEHIETLLSVANLSYSLDYDAQQTLFLRYCSGGDILCEKEITVPPFGSLLLKVSELFGEYLGRADGGRDRYGEILIYPKTGKTYCASYLLRDKRSGRFMLEHVVPVPKFSHEK